MTTEQTIVYVIVGSLMVLFPFALVGPIIWSDWKEKHDAKKKNK